jgi:hypothetical protein
VALSAAAFQRVSSSPEDNGRKPGVHLAFIQTDVNTGRQPVRLKKLSGFCYLEEDTATLKLAQSFLMFCRLCSAFAFKNQYIWIHT